MRYLKGRLRKLEAEIAGEMITIPQQDGTLRRFPPGAGEDALLKTSWTGSARERTPHPSTP